MKIIKKLSLYLASMIPYLASALLLFYTFTASQSNPQNQIDTIQKSLNMTVTQINFFTIIIVLLSNILVLVFTFFIIKLIIIIFDRNKVSKDEDLFFSLILGYTAANLAALLLNDLLNLPFATIMYYTPLIDLITFTTLYYFFSKSKKFTIIIFFTKVIIILTGFFL